MPMLREKIDSLRKAAVATEEIAQEAWHREQAERYEIASTLQTPGGRLILASLRAEYQNLHDAFIGRLDASDHPAMIAMHTRMQTVAGFIRELEKTLADSDEEVTN